jgi:hypothetical protein
MVKSENVLKIHNPPYPEAINGNVVVPLYDIEAAANLAKIMTKENENIIGYISIPNMPSVDGAIENGNKLILGQDTPSPHQVRTKAAPSSLHACITLASFSHEVRSVSAAVSRFKYGKDAGLFYTGLTESDVVIPALKRRKSEGRAKDNQ